MAIADDRGNGGYETLLRGPLFIALGMCAGASAYFRLPFEPILAFMLGLLVAGVTVAGLVLRRLFLPAWGRNLLLFAIGMPIGFALANTHTALRPAPPMSQMIGPVMVEGWVGAVEPGENGPRLRLTVHAIAGADEAGMPAHIRLTHTNRLEVEPGRFVRCWAVIRPPPQPEYPADYPFNRQAWFTGLDGVGYVMGRCRGGILGEQVAAGAALQTRIGAIRRGLARHVDVVAGERAGGFAAALTSGDRSFMRQEDMEALRASGLAHLLAISGLHLGIVGSLAYFFLRRALSAWEWFALRVPTQKPAAAAAILACGTYLILSGASVSTQRAFIMASIAFLAILLDRAPLSLRTFSLALMAVIVMQPASVMTPGFQMSFAATGALISAYEAWSRRQAELGPGQRRGFMFVLKSLMLTSVIGAAATAPFAFFHFGRVAPFGLIANLLAMPIVTFISAPAAGLSLITWPIGLSDICLSVFGWSLERILSIAHAVAGFHEAPRAGGLPMPGISLLIFTAGLVGACLGRSVRQRVVFAAAALAVGGAAWATAPRLVLHWSASGDVYAGTAEGVVRATFAEGDGMSPLEFSDLLPEVACDVDGCALATPAGLILAGPDSWLLSRCGTSPSLVLVTGETLPSECFEGTTIFNWTDVQRTGAITLRRNLWGDLVINQPVCGNRPWQPCLTRPAPRNQS